MTDLPDWAYGVRNLVVLSGAGLSTDSGIQDFRGPGGIWTLNPTAPKKSTYQAFITDPELRGSYWRSRYEHPVWRAEPNAGHLAVAGLTSSELETTVVTQNTDGLHQRAGTPADQVVELHGTMHEVLCVDCGHRSATTDVLARIEAGEAVPDCSRCGGIIKTASTMFGQTMAPAVFARAERAVISCDLVLAVGTTLTVEPAGSLAASAVHAGATLVIVNWDPTPYDGIATELIRDPLGEALPRIAAQLLAGTTRTRPRAAAEPLGDPVPRPVPAPFRSRDTELARLVDWCAGTGPRTHLVSGPAGVGKTRLALELAGRVARDVTFLAPDEDLPDCERPLLVIVDDAETRAAQVTRLVRAAQGRDVCVLLLARRPVLSEVDTSEELTSVVSPPELLNPQRHSAAVTAILCDANEPLPGAPDESLVAAVVSPKFLMNLFMDTTPAQERRALTVLARAAATRPALRDCLTELLSVLPGVSPAAVDAAVHGGYPEPLADALTSLAHNAALPADLLEAIPAGATVLGEFPVLLAQSLVEAYERRADVYPATALPGLVTMLIELAERLADMGRAVEAKAAADRAVAVAARLPHPGDLPARAARTRQRTSELSLAGL